MLIKATFETLYMVMASCTIAVLVGVPLGGLLYMIRPGGLRENRWFYQILSSMINATRSLPFVILMILLIPITRQLVGTSIGIHAAIVPLSLGAIPFFARIVETSFQQVPAGLIDMMVTLGIRPTQLFGNVLLPESLPGLIQGVTLTMVSLVGYSAMAGTIGGGGLGDLAIRYGYQRFDFATMMWTVLILILIVQSIQALGDWISHRCNRKAGVSQWS